MQKMKYLYSTASKQPQRFPSNYPQWIQSAQGVYITDTYGKTYFDMCCSLGAISLGYRYPAVDEAVVKAIRDYGTIFSLQHPLEVELSELICDMIPCAEMVKFGHNGQDVTAGAIRLARYVTGRDLVASFSYHGANDAFMACTNADKGVPQELKKLITDFDYNDFERVKEIFKFKPACIIMEPHTIREPKDNFLHWLRDKCDANNCLLIFDEIVSFPRYRGYSASVHFGVEPDLICIGKGIANGYAISALAGKAEYMKEFKDNGVFMSMTHSGNLVGVAAALATLKEIKRVNLPDHLWFLGKRFKENVKYPLKGSVLSRQFFDLENDKLFKLWQETIKLGLFLHIPIFFNYSMTEGDMDWATVIINNIDISKVELEGEMPKEVFRKL